MKVPLSTSSWHSRSYSSAEPSHHSTAVGLGERRDLVHPCDQLLVGRWGAWAGGSSSGFRPDRAADRASRGGLSTGYPLDCSGGAIATMVGKAGGTVPIPAVSAAPGRRWVGIDEFAVIDRLAEPVRGGGPLRAPGGRVPPPGETWIGDDAAVVAWARATGSCWPPTWWSRVSTSISASATPRTSGTRRSW